MESESTVLMIRAVLMSILLHVLIIYLMALYFSPAEEENEFSTLKVYMFSRSGSSEAPVLKNKADTLEEPVVNKETQRLDQTPAANEQEISADTPRTPAPQTDAIQDHDLSNQSVAAADSASAAVAPDSSLLEPVSEGQNVIAGESERPGDISAKTLDVRWSGAPARLRTITEPSFSLPYGSVLPEEVKISFEVLGDGTSVSVKIIPPGSGSLNLDQQIRSYVASLVFESFGDVDKKRKGLLTLNLRHQESARP